MTSSSQLCYAKTDTIVKTGLDYRYCGSLVFRAAPSRLAWVAFLAVPLVLHNFSDQVALLPILTIRLEPTQITFGLISFTCSEIANPNYLVVSELGFIYYQPYW